MLSDLLGLGASNPNKLPLINIDPTVVQRQTIAGNQQNAPAAFDLASLVNQFSATELNKQLERMMPGYGALRDTATGVIGSELRGEIPKDVERLLQQRAAEKGVTLGTSNSGFADNSLLRSLGLTSLQLTQQGLDSASKWISSIPKAPQFDFTSMFFTPQQRLSFSLQQAQANLPIRSFNNWVDTLPSTQNRAIGEFMNWIENTGRSIVSSYAGSVGGGGAGGGGGGGISQTAGYSMLGAPAYGSTYSGAGGAAYQSAPTGQPGGGMSIPYGNPVNAQGGFL